MTITFLCNRLGNWWGTGIMYLNGGFYASMGQRHSKYFLKIHFCMPNVCLWVLQSNYTGTVICFVLNLTNFVPTSDCTCNCPFGVCNNVFALLHAYFGEYKPGPHSLQWNKWSMVASHWDGWFCMQVPLIGRTVDF